jgi:diaminopimelate epimerase
MKFTKIQGAANDFVLVDAREINRDWSRLAIEVCDRHLGVGADSLLLLMSSDKADFYMRTFDADGSEAETCGNGIRCLARYVLENDMAGPEPESVTVETPAGINTVEFEKADGVVVKFWVNMGKPRFAAGELAFKPLPENGKVVDVDSMLVYSVSLPDIEMNLNLISMGNPHAVYFTGKPVSQFPLARLGPLVEHHPAFTNRVNFMVARVLDKEHLEARSWERGIGETLACGSGACAITVASKTLGYTGNRVDINLPGGTLNAEWNGSREVILGGPAEVVFTGNWPD